MQRILYLVDFEELDSRTGNRSSQFSGIDRPQGLAMGSRERRPSRHTSLACETKSDGKRITRARRSTNCTPVARSPEPRQARRRKPEIVPVAHPHVTQSRTYFCSN